MTKIVLAANRRSHWQRLLFSLLVPMLFAGAATTYAAVESVGSFSGEFLVADDGIEDVVTGTFSGSDLPVEVFLGDGDPIEGIPPTNAIGFDANIFEEIDASDPNAGDPNYNFFTSLNGLGQVDASGTTTIEQTFTNTEGGRASLLVNFTIFPGGVSLPNVITAQARSATIQYEVQRDGVVVYGGTAEANSNTGVVVTGDLSELVDFALVDTPTEKSASWEESTIAMNLGVFQPGESTTITFALTVQIQGAAGCSTSIFADCPRSIAEFNDPCRGCRFVALSGEVTSNDNDGWQEDEVDPSVDIFVDGSDNTPNGNGGGPDGAEFDRNQHPYVGLIVFDYPDRDSERCAGTLMTPTVVLTAGHCTDGATGGRIWFDATEAEILAKGFPDGGSGAVEFTDIFTHPEFDPEEFVLNDVGIVILSDEVPSDVFGTLPVVGELNALKRGGGKNTTTFTAVGHGLAETIAQPARFPLTRMNADLRLRQINVKGSVGGYAMLLSNNPTGGILCLGDSGGPHLIGDSNIIGGVTSFAKNKNCAGTVGVYRLDQEKDRTWLTDCLNGSCN